MVFNNRLLLIASPALALLLAGCRIDTHRNGRNDDVSIGTPFGSMHVKTDDATVKAGLGLTPYPGASEVHKDGHDDGAADVNMSFGNFHLGVHALDLRTSDPESKVVAFYKHDMGRYGTVITCRGKETEGQPTRTAEGLTCSTDQHGEDDDELQLRAGSPVHQHIVGVRSDHGGTRIGLVALDLPSGLNHHDDSDRE